MVALTLCSNQECPQADYCERFTAKRGKKCSIKYFLNNGTECDVFVENAKYKTFAILSGKKHKKGSLSLNEFQEGNLLEIKRGGWKGGEFIVVKARQSGIKTTYYLDLESDFIQPK